MRRGKELRICLASLPAHRNSAMSSVVANQGCEGTGGTIPRFAEPVNAISRVLEFFFFFLDPATDTRTRHSMLIGSTSITSSTPRGMENCPGISRIIAWSGRAVGQRLDVKPVQIADLDDGRGGRAQDTYRFMGTLRQPGRQLFHEVVHGGFLGPPRDQPDDPAEWRDTEPRPIRQLALHETRIIMQHRVVDRRVIGTVGLHQHPPRPIAAARAAGDLGHKLKGPLGGAKSGKCSAVSALTTPTSVTLGKSRPLAIICVPSRICTLPALKSASTSSWLPGLRIESESIRRETWPGKAARTSRSSRSVPIPP